MKKNILYFIVLIIIAGSCKPKPIEQKKITIVDILKEHQWRKIEEAIYSLNNKFEEYLFTFKDAEDCEKNSYTTYSGISEIENYGELTYYDICAEDIYHTYKFNLEADTLYIMSYKDSGFYSTKHITYFDENTFILDYDTIINNVNKKIKETFTAFPKK